MPKLSNKRVLFILRVLAVVGIADTVFVLGIGSGFNFGNVLPGAAGVAILVWLRLRLRIIKMLPPRLTHIASVVAWSLFTVWLATFVVIIGLIVFSIQSNEEVKVENLLILGSGLHGDQVSLTLKQRLDKGVEYLEKNPGVRVIVSGGQGPGETITEAEAMKKYLVSRKIDEDRIIMEDQSTSTMENLVYTREILDKIETTEKNRIMIITSDFHLFRARFLAKRNGLEAYGIPSGTPFYLWPNCYIREYLAVVKSFFVDR